EPPKPSARLSTMQQARLSTIAGQRGLEAHRLSQQLRSELDWIVMKALEKDRNRRYESASALAADVQHYLNDEPVPACPPSLGYRVGKLFRRHRRAVLTAGVVVVSLLVGMGLSIWQALAADEARQNAETAKDRAEIAEGKANADRDFARKAEE